MANIVFLLLMPSMLMHSLKWLNSNLYIHPSAVFYQRVCWIFLNKKTLNDTTSYIPIWETFREEQSIRLVNLIVTHIAQHYSQREIVTIYECDIWYVTWYTSRHMQLLSIANWWIKVSFCFENWKRKLLSFIRVTLLPHIEQNICEENYHCHHRSWYHRSR